MDRVVPFGDDPIRLKEPDPEQLEATARKIARQIRAYAQGPDNVPQTWVDAAYLLGCHSKKISKNDKHAGEGYYNPKAPDGPTLFYRIRPSDSPMRICARIIHELAHHLLVHWKGSRFPRGWERYNGSNTEQHEIARRVEKLVLKCEDFDE